MKIKLAFHANVTNLLCEKMHNQWRVTINEVILAWILAISNSCTRTHKNRALLELLSQEKQQKNHFINMASWLYTMLEITQYSQTSI